MVKKINIFGVKYKVIKDIPKKYIKQFPPEDNYGLCFREDKLIWVSDKIKGKTKHEVMLHEIGHGCLAESSISYSGLLDEAVEELVVDTIAKGSYQYMKELIKDALKEEDVNKLRDKLHSIIK